MSPPLRPCVTVVPRRRRN